MNRKRRDPPDMRSLARSFAPMSVRSLAMIARTGVSESARVSAANSILEWGYGKPEQSSTLNAEIQITVRKLFANELQPEVIDVSPNAVTDNTNADKPKPNTDKPK